jgi:hypothetical protein
LAVRTVSPISMVINETQRERGAGYVSRDCQKSAW